jgi:hypothetical protein
MPVAHSRFGSVALGLSALLLTAFPLIRPFFRMDPREPAETLAAASPFIVSTSWAVAHLLCTLAFVLLLYGLIAVYATLASNPAERRAFWAMVLSLAGIALILPMLGVETYMLPVLGKLYQAGQSQIFPAIGMIYGGLALAVFLMALLLLAIGAIMFAIAIWRSGVLPRWAGILLAAGLALWFPPFPEVVRIVDGFVIGVGGVWLAASLWQRASDRQAR